MSSLPMRPGIVALGLAMASSGLWAQPATLPPLFENATLTPRRSQVVAELPQPTFLENLVFDRRGIGFVTSHLDGTVYRLAKDGRLEKLAVLPGKIAGIALDARGGLVVSGADAQGLAVVHRLTPQGQLLATTPIPEATFLNGIVHERGDEFLVADSYKGVIWRVDVARGTSAIWLQHALLSRADDQNLTPGVNGMKRVGDRVWVSNTARQLLLTVARARDGSAGTPTMRYERVNVDDFVIDADSSMLAATHVYKTGRVTNMLYPAAAQDT